MRAGNNGGGRKKGSGIQGDRVYIRIPRDMKAMLVAEATSRCITLSDLLRQIILAGVNPTKQLASILREREPDGLTEMTALCYPLMTAEESDEFDELMIDGDPGDETTPVEWLHDWRRKRGLSLEDMRKQVDALAEQFEKI